MTADFIRGKEEEAEDAVSDIKRVDFVVRGRRRMDDTCIEAR